MTDMTELTENTDLHGAVEPAESVTVEDKTSLTKAFENTLEISQGVELPQRAASEETDSREKPEQEDRQQDGETASPPAAEFSSTESKWVVGAQCRAVWSEDGRVYPATVVSLDGERCRVRFNGYGNEEDVELSALQRPDAALPTQRQNSQDWKPGSRCRAVYSEDGLVYPAAVLWVKGQRCRVRFDNYDNEEEQDVSSLLSPNELHGPSRAAAAKGSNRKSSVISSNSDWKSREEQQERGGGGGGGGGGGERRSAHSDWKSREEQQERRGGGGGGERRSAHSDWKSRSREEQQERGGERRSERRDEEQNSSWVKEKPSRVETEETRTGNQQRDEKPTNHSFSFFPPFPPPPQPGSGGPVSFVPPPPPLWTFGGKESDSSPAVDATSSMLMLWYMCGFHTGSYMAQQESRSKD